MPTLHVVVTKSFDFQGKPERWSNGYNIQTGANDITPAYAEDVAKAIRDMERSFLANYVLFPYLVAGPLGQDAVFTEEHENPPPGNRTNVPNMHPELCVLAQAKIGPKRYLMKYYHGCVGMQNGGEIEPGGQNAVALALKKLNDGTLPGGAAVCRPNGALVPADWEVDKWIRVHQLKRRGRRP